MEDLNLTKPGNSTFKCYQGTQLHPKAISVAIKVCGGLSTVVNGVHLPKIEFFAPWRYRMCGQG